MARLCLCLCLCPLLLAQPHAGFEEFAAQVRKGKALLPGEIPQLLVQPSTGSEMFIAEFMVRPVRFAMPLVRLSIKTSEGLPASAGRGIGVALKGSMP